MNIRRFRSLHAAGATYAEIARECGVDWRTVKKYLADSTPATPPSAPPRAGTQPRAITPELEALIRSWLVKDVELKASVIHERLVAEHGFTGHYQRVKMACQVLRPAVAAELDLVDDNPLVGLHRRFATVPGAQAQVDWGDEGDLFGIGVKVYSFHMVLSFSRDPFACFTTSMDAGTFWHCHRRAFAHFGGVPGTIVFDRTKTIVKRHVAPVRRSRCTRRRSRSPSTTGSSSTCWPRAGRPARDGSSGRSPSCATTCWPADRSPACPRWMPRSCSGCRSAAGRSTAPPGR